MLPLKKIKKKNETINKDIPGMKDLEKIKRTQLT